MPEWAKWSAVAAILLALSSATFLYFQRLESRSDASLEVVPLTGMAGIENDPAFSPDGNQVAFTLGNAGNGKSGIYTTLIGGEKALQLTNDSGDCCPTWSPDGRSIAFVRHVPKGYVIDVLPALGGTPRTAHFAEGELREHISMPLNISWSPDGQHLAASTLSEAQNQRAITLISLAGGPGRTITSPPPEYSDWCATFSPDGKFIAFLRSSGPGLVDDLYVVAVSGGEPKRLTFDRREMGGAPTWTPDSREIIFPSTRSGLPSLWRIPASGGMPARVQGVGISAFGPAIALRANRLAYVDGQYAVDLWMVQLADPKHAAHGEQLILASKGQTGLAHISPDSRKVVFESTRSGYPEIWTANTDGSDPVQLTFLTGTSGTPRWSYDGRSVAFDYRPGDHSEIDVVEVAGGSPRTLRTVPGADNTVPSWSRDGKWIYFSSNRGNEATHVWKLPYPSVLPSS